jgi:LPXTG-site transpeptidase (sortase) family protein
MYSRRPHPVSRLLRIIPVFIVAVAAYAAYQNIPALRGNANNTPIATNTETAPGLPPTQAASPVSDQPSAQPSAQPTSATGLTFWIYSEKANFSASIVPVFINEDRIWDVSTLENYVGHLEGTAAWGTGGNFVLAGHVELRGGIPGPFVNLHTLQTGDEITVAQRIGGGEIISARYAVTDVLSVAPEDMSVVQNRGYEELTLITCDDWDQRSGTYRSRTVVHARLAR